MQLQIPSRFEKSLVDFLGMSRDVRMKFIDAIQTAPVMLNHKKLATYISTNIEFENKKIVSIVAMLASLYRTMEDTPIDDFINDFYDAAISLDKISEMKIDWNDIKKDLKTILSSDHTLGVTSKALDIRSHFPNTFCDSRILSDIRPVFGKNADNAPQAALVIHTLCISYHQETYGTKDYYVTLDSQDLKKLRKLIERAIKKEASLKSLIDKTDINYLDFEDF